MWNGEVQLPCHEDTRCADHWSFTESTYLQPLRAFKNNKISVKNQNHYNDNWNKYQSNIMEETLSDFNQSLNLRVNKVIIVFVFTFIQNIQNITIFLLYLSRPDEPKVRGLLNWAGPYFTLQFCK